MIIHSGLETYGIAYKTVVDHHINIISYNPEVEQT